MKCPRIACQSTDHITVKTYSQTSTQKIPKKFGNLNIYYRKRKCRKCNNIFYSIELPFMDFDKYFDKATAMQMTGETTVLTVLGLAKQQEEHK